MRNVAGQEPWMPRLLPQQDVEACGNRYRLDFMLESGKIAIELDGHDFHERTKEQVEHRNKRDRDLQSDGWLVLHYSGSKFLSEPMNCILEVTAIWESRKPKAE
jgi:very-short-patch-repair endonuclease